MSLRHRTSTESNRTKAEPIERSETVIQAPRAGDPAPALDVPALGGGRVRLADEAGRPVIVSFLRHAG